MKPGDKFEPIGSGGPIEKCETCGEWRARFKDHKCKPSPKPGEKRCKHGVHGEDCFECYPKPGDKRKKYDVPCPTCGEAFTDENLLTHYTCAPKPTPSASAPTNEEYARMVSKEPTPESKTIDLLAKPDAKLDTPEPIKPCEAREWWLAPPVIKGATALNAYTYHTSTGIHVIEHSAWTAACKERDDQRAAALALVEKWRAASEERDRLRAIVDNLPKVPTESYEREMAKEIVRLRAALERIASAKCPKYVAHPQSVWFDIHVQDIARQALSKVADKADEKYCEHSGIKLD